MNRFTALGGSGADSAETLTDHVYVKMLASLGQKLNHHFHAVCRAALAPLLDGLEGRDVDLGYKAGNVKSLQRMNNKIGKCWDGRYYSTMLSEIRHRLCLWALVSPKPIFYSRSFSTS